MEVSRGVGEGRPRHLGQKGPVAGGRTLGLVTVGIVDDQDALLRQSRAEVGAGHQGEVLPVGDQELALGVGEVAGQLVAAVGGIGPDHDRTGQSRPAHPEDELGHVVEEQGDMERARSS